MEKTPKKKILNFEAPMGPRTDQNRPEDKKSCVKLEKNQRF